ASGRRTSNRYGRSRHSRAWGPWSWENFRCEEGPRLRRRAGTESGRNSRGAGAKETRPATDDDALPAAAVGDEEPQIELVLRRGNFEMADHEFPRRPESCGRSSPV